jgi:hypothetical protein
MAEHADLDGRESRGTYEKGRLKDGLAIVMLYKRDNWLAM